MNWLRRPYHSLMYSLYRYIAERVVWDTNGLYTERAKRHYRRMADLTPDKPCATCLKVRRTLRIPE